ncbi:Hypothetical protein, putative [Bodo saltans]|uniref:Uncharacterized protein n=1 Tax=Bodo saltans TaxID=75058 RepID=A0A0S4KKP9_BODSA|nr:Hypothetical protein, putative [Bodo saltans]|eukprot:CUI14975.1 Hypothetical protein, putative [Bodo saltans]
MGSTQYQETTAHEGHVPSDDAEVSYSESDLHSVEEVVLVVGIFDASGVSTDAQKLRSGSYILSFSPVSSTLTVRLFLNQYSLCTFASITVVNHTSDALLRSESISAAVLATPISVLVENSASDLQQMQRRFGQPVVGFLALHPTGSLGTVESHATSVGCGDSASDTSPRQRSHYFKLSPPYENSQGVNPLRSQSSPRSSTPTQHRRDTMKLSFKEDPAQRIRTPSVGFLALHPTCKEESS